MKKTLKVCLASLLAVTGAAALASCNGGNQEKVKIGLITLHDENSTYDKNFIDGMKAACEKKNAELILVTDKKEEKECQDAAEDLADQGCKAVFADSFGHEPWLMEAAKNYPDVTFAHATGTHAWTEKLPNFHNAFASIYEGRYLAGVAAGLKLQEMGKTNAPKIGYVGAFTYAEVISGYTSFYLGVKSIVPSVTMDVQFTGSWYDEAAEKNAANALIDSGAVLISQHADSMGAPSACETKNVPNVSYNGPTGTNTNVISSRINWQPYFEKLIDSVNGGAALETDYTGSLKDGMVEVSAPQKGAVANTQAKLDEVKAKLENGSLKVFDTNNFTVGGAKLTSYKADCVTDDAFTPDTEVVSNGYFHESETRSAPYFDVQIDGITLLNTKF